MSYRLPKLSNISTGALKSFARLFAIAVLFNLVLFVAAINAQNTVTGAFQGDVSNDLTGEPISLAVVQITQEQTGVIYNLTTDSQGRFYLGLLQPGFYRISVSANGLRPRLLRREIKLSSTDNVVPVPVSLEPESPLIPSIQPSQAVLEEADNIRVEINTTDARRDGSFKDETITKIPLGSTTLSRSFDELALLLPGVAPPPQTVGDIAGPGVGAGVGSAGQFAVNGLRSRGNNFTVDGSDNNDEDIGVRRQGFLALNSQPIESVKEYQVITLLAPAQFGRNIGAQVNAVSKAGGNNLNGTLYGFFNSNRLNARNFFDTKNGNDTFALKSTTGQSVLLDGQPLMVRNASGEEDSFTFGQAGGTVGGSIVPNKLFYFLSGEYQKINAVQEKNFAVPTIEQRGPFRTGASGVFRNFLTGQNVSSVPNTPQSAALFSLFPFSNNPEGVYGENNFTQVLPASARGVILSGRLDNSFKFGGRQQTVTGRYNFTDDKRIIPAINEAIFSSVQSKTQTQNFSFFLNSQLSNPDSNLQLFNQVRLSLGRTRLSFDEVRGTEYMIQSERFSNIPFLLNTPLRYNETRPSAPGVPNTGPVLLTSSAIRIPGGRTTAEQLLGPIGQVIVRGFSSLGTDVYNFPQTRINNTYQIADELSARLQNHTLVFGGDVRRTDLNSDLPRLSRPLLIFNGAPRLTTDIRETGCPNGGIARFFCFVGLNEPNPIIRAEDLAGLNAASNFLLTFNVDRPDAKADLRFYQFNFYGQDVWRIRDNLSIAYGLRYEYNSPVHEVNRLIEQSFSDPRLFTDPREPFQAPFAPFSAALVKLIDGRKTLYEADLNNFAPRIGLAFSPNFFGNSRTSVFRAGYGIFYDQILGAVVNQSRNVFPTFSTVDFGGGSVSGVSFPDNLLIYSNPGGFSPPNIICDSNGCVPCTILNGVCSVILLGRPLPIVLPGTINVTIPENRNRPPRTIGQITLPERKLEMPMAHHYSFVYEQQLNANFALSVGYIGTAGRKLLRFTTPNLGASKVVALTDLRVFGNGYIAYGLDYDFRRPLSGIGTINQFETTASSNYNSLQTQLRARFSNNLNFQASYTFSKVTDDVSDVFDLAGAYVLPQNSLTFEGERAPANFDVRHRWTYQTIYNFPKFETNSFLRVLTNKLQVASTGRFHSGQPFTVNSTIDVNLDGNLTDRLNTLQGIEITGDRRQPVRLTTDNPFSLLAPFGTDGSVKRNSFRAGNVLELDLSVIKQFSIRDRQLSFRADVLNFINRTNFGIPVRLLEAPGFGKATNTVTPGRRIQLSLKYEF
jgi:hypothetical protein